MILYALGYLSPSGSVDVLGCCDNKVLVNAFALGGIDGRGRRLYLPPELTDRTLGMFRTGGFLTGFNGLADLALRAVGFPRPFASSANQCTLVLGWPPYDFSESPPRLTLPRGVEVELRCSTMFEQTSRAYLVEFRDDGQPMLHGPSVDRSGQLPDKTESFLRLVCEALVCEGRPGVMPADGPIARGLQDAFRLDFRDYDQHMRAVALANLFRRAARAYLLENSTSDTLQISAGDGLVQWRFQGPDGPDHVRNFTLTTCPLPDNCAECVRSLLEAPPRSLSLVRFEAGPNGRTHRLCVDPPDGALLRWMESQPEATT